MNSPWLQTIGAGFVDLVNPKPEQINLRVVVRVLCRLPRFGGHTEGEAGDIYSVGQHTREGVRAVLRETGREDAACAFALHDVHEYVLGDKATPVFEAHVASAREIAFEQGIYPGQAEAVVARSWKRMKARLDAAIYARAGVPYPLAPDVAAIVHEFDLRMCRAERDARLAPSPMPWVAAVEEAEPLAGCDFHLYRPGTMEALLLAQFEELGISVDNVP